MNKQELVASVAKKTDMPKSTIQNIVDCTFESISASLKKGQQVRMVGFGTWKKQKRKARTGRNPKTGNPLKIAARNVSKFSMSSQLYDLLN
ncbi:MAG: HU family DNA-binding protein [Candidatus Margulisiibacteriota bacterium]